MPARPSGVGQQRGEPQHPPVDRDVVDLDTALGEELLDVTVGPAEAQLPADRQDDHVGWEQKLAKAERATNIERGLQVLMPTASLVQAVTAMQQRRAACRAVSSEAR